MVITFQVGQDSVPALQVSRIVPLISSPELTLTAWLSVDAVGSSSNLRYPTLRQNQHSIPAQAGEYLQHRRCHRNPERNTRSGHHWKSASAARSRSYSVRRTSTRGGACIFIELAVIVVARTLRRWPLRSRRSTYKPDTRKPDVFDGPSACWIARSFPGRASPAASLRDSMDGSARRGYHIPVWYSHWAVWSCWYLSVSRSGCKKGQAAHDCSYEERDVRFWSDAAQHTKPRLLTSNQDFCLGLVELIIGATYAKSAIFLSYIIGVTQPAWLG